uniref:Dehydrogenase/reductase SDR family member 6 n=1 Tax=Caligus clemensi TaxID=344056 RepID=C1C0W0_CALCM|nr:3-hydroxybutyrate dehydrogenase type 2 [Caligus clemensi]
MGRLEGKVALITAAAQGIGRETAIRFASEGAKVIATDVNSDKLSELSAIPSIETYTLDATDKIRINEFADLLEVDIDILFNCVGFVAHGSILDCDEDDWRASFQVNVDSMYYVCKAFIPKMINRGKGGSIINMSSICSSLKGLPNRFAYGTTKAAVIGLTKSLAIDLVSHKIRVNCICPGTVDTPSLRGRVNNAEDPKKAYKNFIQRQPLQRLGTPSEIASFVLTLAEDDGAYCTGGEFKIDGGLSI